jgi:signal transduction histidine kinase
MKLVPRLTIAFMLGTTSVLAVDGYVNVQREVEIFQLERTDDVRQVGKTIARDVERIAGAEGAERALAFVRQADIEERPLRIRWVWFDAPPGDPQHPDVLPASAEAEPRLGVYGHDVHGEGRYYLFFPAALPGSRKGALEVSRLESRVKDFTQRTFRSIMAMTALAAAVSACVALAAGRLLVGGPMRAIMVQARRVGAGDFSGRLDAGNEDELGELAREMNAMCDRLAEARARLADETRARIATLEQLRHADRLSTVGRLAAGIAHELGTPLNVIGGRAKMILSNGAVPARAGENARIVVEQAERMTGIIRQLLDFARPRSPDRARHDARELARKALDLLTPLAGKKDVTLALDPGPEAVVEVDAAQIQQALTNLLVNAIQAMKKPGTVRVEIARERAAPPPEAGIPEGEFVRVTVHDEGEGVSPDNISRIFEPFFTTKDVGEGTGLGLPVSYGIIREHGGWISVESELGSGSRFAIHLPPGHLPPGGGP